MILTNAKGGQISQVLKELSIIFKVKMNGG